MDCSDSPYAGVVDEVEEILFLKFPVSHSQQPTGAVDGSHFRTKRFGNLASESIHALEAPSMRTFSTSLDLSLIAESRKGLDCRWWHGRSLFE
jgi:hypothetical protein